ncbi:four-carbon acid sugar kinase family protein [Acidovorax sp. CCYZU-2555]|uniref:four-carbon acid sugar kinase family protein n=1 Tax=Acidovorax sp. CCYZU-2555 TaxID=2835042 RepID=UPI001BCA6BF0|nr:four-carbon acid sugar kinase family protein [Acidovorax sp. CCYZU-2555]MBS7780340.1 four-carbon acid sugar kinase family protein [Acidovorax sp. CCYZU-2555]
MPSMLKIAYYGDDFTGATDTLATAARAGLRTLLFLGLPSPAQLERAGPLDCLGIAGAARAMTPAEMQSELEPVGRLFAQLGAPVMHYKTCSTFDSAAHIGSIGTAIRVLQPHAGNAFVPIVGGQPNLRRYCVFGNLFASAGAAMHRIDRHPTMRRHPVTPMHEADLRLHFAQQGLQLASLDYTDYAQAESELDQQLCAVIAQQPDAVLLDIARTDDLVTVGRLIWQHARQQPLLAAGPSSVVQALAAHWQGPAPAVSAAIAPAVDPVLVLAGSLSPMTARQVKAASSYEHLLLDAPRLANDAAYRTQMAQHIATRLKRKVNMLACTSSGGEIAATDAPTNARALAMACGELLAQVLKWAPIKRLGVAGGDTSSHAVQALDAWGLSYQAQLAPGVALCRLHSDDPALDGLEIMLKGGQMGSETLFEQLLSGNC